MKDITFFNAESASYSAKRYPERAQTFTQFFFKERLAKTLVALNAFLPEHARVLELGCADGIVAARITERFPERIATFDANDIAPEMITAARAHFGALPIQFSVRTESAIHDTYDAIVEIGVLNYTDLEPELTAVAEALAPNGRYVCSIAGSSSFQNRLKGGEGYKHLRSYAEYEQEFAKRFRILERHPVGIFVPYLWKVPAIARVLQPLVEAVFGTLMPRGAHEFLYVLESI